MNTTNFKKLEIDDGNGHIWVEILNRPIGLIGKIACSQCGYLRRVDEKGTPLNKTCVGKVKVTLR